MKTLTIKYQIEEKQNKILDKGIGKLAEKLGYEWYAEGFNFTDGYRDLCFKNKEE